MKPTLLSLWRCPRCHHTDTHLNIQKEKQEILSGAVVCQHCRMHYPISSGILQTEPQLSKGMVDEMRSVREQTDPEAGLVFPLEKNVAVNDEWLLNLPVPGFHAGQWNPKMDIAFAMEKIQLRQTQRVLDLGAGVCWTTRELARKTPHCVAVDILNDKYLGLASAEVYIEKYGNYFERVNTAMEDLPFQNDVFDVVVTQCSAHHADDLDTLLQEIKRVLKMNGWYIMTGELTQGIFKKSRLEGNDHFYTIRDYVERLVRNGFEPQLFFPASLHDILMSGSLQRKSDKWRGVGRLASRFYSLPFFRTLVQTNVYFMARFFGVPPIIISQIKI